MRHVPGFLQAVSAIIFTAGLTALVTEGKLSVTAAAALGAGVSLFIVSVILGSKRVRRRIRFLWTSRMRILDIRRELAELYALLKRPPPGTGPDTLDARLAAADTRYHAVLSQEAEHLYPAIARKAQHRMEGVRNHRDRHSLYMQEARYLVNERLIEIDRVLESSEIK